jgi:hypothetical protein
MDKTESTVHITLTAIKAPLYDVGVLSERGTALPLQQQCKRQLPYFSAPLVSRA